VEVLDRRTLNRATLERQLLHRRDGRGPLEALSHLIAVQAQEPHEPYVGLWTRLATFEPAQLVELLEGRRAVRTLLMRRTLHLVTAEDCLRLRPHHQAMLVARARGTLGRLLPEVDFEELAVAGEPWFAETPRTLSEVGRLVQPRWPATEPRVLGDALSSLVPLVQTPPRGLWGHKAPARNTTIRVWLGADPATTDEALDELVLRYLLAYGPAASSDVRAWSGLSGLPAVITRLRPRLRSYRDERGRELLDTLDGKLPDPNATPPVRFLPAFDNAVLGYDDRSRIIDDEHRGLSVAGARFVLVDGRVAATWTFTGDATAGVEVEVSPLRPLSPAERADLTEEAAALAAFLGDGVAGRVRLG
jgi:Winged helix DNA-binding domain